MSLDVIQLPSDGAGKKLFSITKTLSGDTVYMEAHAITDASGGIISPANPLASTVSGTVITSKTGSPTILFSGYGATNTVVTSGIAFTEHEQMSIGLYHLGEGSGVNYSIIAYQMSGIMPFVTGSGVLYSGDIAVETLTDTYDYVAVGVDNTQDNFSGLVTVIVSRR